MQLYEDIVENQWVGDGGVVLRKLGKKVFVVHTPVGSGQFNTKKKALDAIEKFWYNTLSPQNHPDNLARLWTND